MAALDLHQFRRPFWRSTLIVALVAAALATGFYLYSEHRGHVFVLWPYLFLLACPVMHLFMHRGHGGHGGHAKHELDGHSKDVETKK